MPCSLKTKHLYTSKSFRSFSASLKNGLLQGEKDQGVVFLEMATANLSWQDILNNLTGKAKKDGLIRSIKNAKTIEAKVDKVIDSISIRYFCT